MKMRHCMIDLETLGTAANAPVIAIGAVFFDPTGQPEPQVAASDSELLI